MLHGPLAARGPLSPVRFARSLVVQAVHSENTKNLQNDMWRLYQLSKSTSKPDHAYHKFGTGNLETLKDSPEVRELPHRCTQLQR